ncbi:Asp23/Gls24 family envelope stress response protein [Streptomyces niger]|uniref:Asp23/Gls24 family envelope stress response protein n=1 Tax=Streptomyces niger TaxID=66373 RepID=UPI000B2F9E4A|nr:Asp23/Gls24 family envelope stress response protein [Streptomyces niger]
MSGAQQAEGRGRTDRELRALLQRTAADAARNTPGVAYLRPGLGDLVRGTVPLLAAADEPRVAGVRAEPDDEPGRWRLRIHLAVRRGHRALDVARAVRAEVLAAVRRAYAPEGPEHHGVAALAVTVTVTDLA